MKNNNFFQKLAIGLTGGIITLAAAIGIYKKPELLPIFQSATEKETNSDNTFTNYSDLTDQQLTAITAVAFSEQTTNEGAAAIISTLANIFEEQYDGTFNEMTGSEGFYNFIKSYLRAEYMDSGKLADFAGGRTVTDREKEIINAVLDGNRTIPKGVDSFDVKNSNHIATTPDGENITNCFDKYEPGKTHIHTIYGDYTFFTFSDQYILGFSDENKLGSVWCSYKDLCRHLDLFKDSNEKNQSNQLNELGQFILEHLNWADHINPEALTNGYANQSNYSDIYDVLIRCSEIKSMLDSESLDQTEYPESKLVRDYHTRPEDIDINQFIPHQFINYDLQAHKEIYDISKMKKCLIDNILSYLHKEYNIDFTITTGEEVSNYAYFSGIPEDLLCNKDVKSIIKAPSTENMSPDERIALLNYIVYANTLINCPDYSTFVKTVENSASLFLFLREPTVENSLFNFKETSKPAYQSGINQKASFTIPSKNFRLSMKPSSPYPDIKGKIRKKDKSKNRPNQSQQTYFADSQKRSGRGI